MVNYLYIHIPFCIRKCIYCDFYSIPFKPGVEGDYVAAICKEIELRRNLAGELKTVYIGGGTPTILSEESISKILNTIRENLKINFDSEITIEANPRTITVENAENLIKSGINRVSIGVQSFIDDELKMLGRSHNADDAVSAVRDIKRAGFKNISVDLIYAIPSFKSQIPNSKSQIQNWQYTLLKTLELSPEHISTYELTPEKNTPIFDDIEKGRLILPDEDVIVEMYYRAIDMLTENGYRHYEISNFAKPGHECLHNLNYWQRGEYLGIGAGAHSFFDGKRFCNARDVFNYREAINSGRLPVTEEVDITADETLKEFIFLGLRKIEGININLIPDEKRALIIKAVDDMINHGLVELENNHLRLTRKGLLLSNEILTEILLYIE